MPSTDSGSDQTVDTDGYSRRGFMSTAAAVGATAATAGCIGDGLGDTLDTGEEEFLWWTMRGYIPEETAAIQEAAEDFEDWHDDEITVSTEINTWDVVFTEWAAGIEGREMPNVSEMANEHAVDFGDQGAAIPNTDLYEEYDDWYDATGVWGLWEDEKWGFPWFIEVRNLHVNMDLLDEAGHSDIPETWEDLIEVCQDIEAETDATGFGTPGALDFVCGQNLYSIAQQAGADYYDYDEDAEEWRVEFDSAGSLFAHLWYASLREAWDIAPGGWGGVDGDDLEALYQDNRLGISFQPSDLARSLIDPFDGIDEDHEEVAEATELATMAGGPVGDDGLAFMGGSCLTAFDDQVTRHDTGDQLKMDFIEYMTLPDTLDMYFPAAAPTFLPVRTGQEEMDLYVDNPTEIPDSWLEARLQQGRQSVRYGVTDTGRSAPVLGALEGETTAYSAAMSSIIGEDADPKEAVTSLANTMREEVEAAEGYSLEEGDPDNIDLDDAPDEVQAWIDGDDVPQIWNPY